MVPADTQLVEENLSSISYEGSGEMRSIEAVSDERSSEEPRICLPISQNQEQTPICVLTNSIGTDIQESSLEEIQLVHEKSYMPEHQVSQNIETVRVLFDKNRKRNANNLKCCVYWQQHSLEDLVRFKCNYFL